MSPPPDILFITWNRREYVERSLSTLLADDADFRVHCWDNASTDGARELIGDARDPRIVSRHLSDENVRQAAPTYWLLEQARSDVIGKLDDDTLVPPGWTDELAPPVREETRLGMVGCWTYWPEDYERNRAAAERKLRTLGRHRVLHNMTIGGTAFLMRRELAERYLIPAHHGNAFPVDKVALSRAGFISGWYHPLIVAEHMDDPRSEHCLMNRPNGMELYKAVTARVFGIHTPADYQRWIMDDVDAALTTSVRRQLLSRSRLGQKFRAIVSRLQSTVARLRPQSTANDRG